MQPSIRPIGLQITLENGKSITLDSAQFQKLPRETVRVINRDGGEVTYSGVALSPLLALVGTPAGEQLRGKALAYYIIAQGMDGYRVTLSIAEADQTYNDRHILIADRINDCPLPENAQPLQLIIPGDKRTSRWVRMLAKIEVRRVP